MTQLERIKSMSSEQLKEFIADNCYCTVCNNAFCTIDCKIGIKNWLESEVTDG